MKKNHMRKINRKSIVFLMAALLTAGLLVSGLLTACSAPSGTAPAKKAASSSSSGASQTRTAKASSKTSPSKASAAAKAAPSSKGGLPAVYTWNEKKAPDYVLRAGAARVSKAPAAGQVVYSPLDSLGRTRTVTATVTYAMVARSAGRRQEIPEDQAPSGWGHNGPAHIALYNGRVYNGYFWNRSHLLADSLGGQASRRNLITGTRTQNVGANDGSGGMAFTERRVVQYLNSHHQVTCFYRATPVYIGSELLPRAVAVDVRTSDRALDMRVIVYNCAKGYTINYRTGTYSGSGASTKKAAGSRSASNNGGSAARSSSSASSGSSSGKSASSSRSSSSAGAIAPNTTVYVTGSGKRYHRTTSCPGLRQAKRITPVTAAEAKRRHKTPCAICWR